MRWSREDTGAQKTWRPDCFSLGGCRVPLPPPLMWGRWRWGCAGDPLKSSSPLGTRLSLAAGLHPESLAGKMHKYMFFRFLTTRDC